MVRTLQVRYLTMSADDLWKTPILSQLLTPHECSSLIGFTSGRLTVEELPPHLRRHLERMQTKRLVPWTSSALAPAAASAATCSQQVESRKSCVTEKIFVCLACIFEWCAVCLSRFDLRLFPALCLVSISYVLPCSPFTGCCSSFIAAHELFRHSNQLTRFFMWFLFDLVHLKSRSLRCLG